jgi:Tol biopolymer transport system component
MANIVGVDWTPGGERLAYLVSRTLCMYRPGPLPGPECGAPRFSAQGCQLVVARPSGIGSALVHDLGPSCDWEALAWIDEGRVLAAIGPQLLVLDADTGAKRFVDVLSDATTFDLSPDRQRIAMLRSVEPDSVSVVVSDLTGAVQLQLDGPCGGGCSGLSWAPDGRRLLLTGSNQGQDSSTTDAWVISTSDGSLTELTIADGYPWFAWFDW